MIFLWLWFYMGLYFYVKTFKGKYHIIKKHLDFSLSNNK